MIHPTAVISEAASIGDNVTIGPFCVIGDNVTIGDNCTLQSHVVINGHTTIGSDNTFFPFAAIGQLTQDLKFNGEETYLIIGDRNTFRENTTIHRSTSPDTPTTIGDDNLFLCYVHIAHDCIVGNHCIFSNNATLAGHVTIADHVIIAGLTGIHQFCRVGAHAMIGGLAKITKDVVPYTITDGHPATVRGINQIGLSRRGFSTDDIKALRRAYKQVFLKSTLNLKDALAELKASDCASNSHVKHLTEFIETSERGVIR